MNLHITYISIGLIRIVLTSGINLVSRRLKFTPNINTLEAKY